jgi:hypothetical protein
MASGKLRQEREEWRGLELEGWDCHEPGERQRRRADRFDEVPDLADRTAALLLLLSNIDLDLDIRSPAGLTCFLDQRIEEGAAVERLNRIEQLHRIIGLVRLQATDAVQSYVWTPRQEGGPFAKRLLHSILPEIPLAAIDQRLDIVH